ncbi:MAG: elongation factor EF-2 [Candidatus Aenigmarchaeota archaeon]|nr:elongation factor EF-2 [Candidatus Aenigmarchaeota archaeon]
MPRPRNRFSNCYIYEFVHHGKCVSPDTRIALSNGKFVEAETIFKEFEHNSKLVRENRDEKIIDISHLDFTVPSFNKDALKIENKKVTHIWRLKSTESLLEVVLADGKSIKVTPEHKFILFDKSCEITEKPSNELKIGDAVLCPRKLDYYHVSIDEVKRIFLTKLSDDIGFYVYLDDEYKNHLHKRIVENNRELVWKEIGSPLKLLSFYHGVWRGRYRLKDLLKIIKRFGVKEDHIYEHIKFLSYRKGLKRFGSRASVKLRLPKTEYEWGKFFYLVGLMFGDGSVNLTLDNKDSYIHKEVIKICKEILQISPSIKVYGKKCPRIYLNGGFTLEKIFEILFEYPRIDKSHNIKIPEILEIVSKKLLASFIRGYMDADGTVEQTSVSATSVSKGFLHSLSLNLLKFGCTSWINKKEVKLNNRLFEAWVLYISGKALYAYSQIGFELPHKQNKFDKLLFESENNKKFDYLNIDNFSKLENPNGNRIYTDKELGYSLDTIHNIIETNSQNATIQLQEKLNLLKRFVDNKFYTNRIKEIRKVYNIEFVYDFSVPDNKNFVAEGLIIHNTTLTDNLMAGAGMIAEEMSGKAMVTWFDPEERKRQLTVYGANVSMVHEFEGQDYLINLVDTPGHVDFGGDVTKAMRAVDGTIVLIDPVEGIMPQTETVLRQALREYVKPVLFINKVDRFIRELKLTPEQMQRRFEEVIRDVNMYIQKYAPEEYKQKWLVNVIDGSVVMGSAFRKWAISIPYMKKTGITFKDIIELTLAENEDELVRRAPMHQVVLDTIVRHLPNPIDSQKYRLPKIWKGDLDSQVGKDMLACNPDGQLAMIITKMVPDPHVGFVATGRVFSGRVFRGKDAQLLTAKKQEKIQQVAVYKGIQRIPVEEIPAGNIVGLVGMQDAFTGETVTDAGKTIEPFEEIKHLFEPVVTKSIEPKNPMDLPKLVDALKRLGREDPTLAIKINQETGEYLVSGLGELHLEIKVEHKLQDLGIDVEMSKPIVVYRETIFEPSPEIEGKSPNKHNKFAIKVEPLEEGVYQAMMNGELPSDGTIKKKNIELFQKFRDSGMDYDEARNIVFMHNKNVFIDMTKGVQFLNEVIEMVKDAFVDVMDDGPLARDPCTKLKIKLFDAELHEDPVHRGEGQIRPAVRWGIRQAMLVANAQMLEPKQIIRIDIPSELIGEAIREVENRRGQIIDMKDERGASVITAKLPVSDMFGFDASLKSATSGRGFYSLIETSFERVPKDLFESVVRAIRKRKGLPEDIPQPEV